jgi:uncharacterized membrane protein
MHIDHNAPLVARREIFIDVPIEDVWNILCEIPRWSDWQPEIQAVHVEGEPRPGVRFRWRVDHVDIASTLEAVEPPRHIGWVSRSPGMTAIHTYHLEAHGKRTRVVTEESRSGWSARLLKLSSPDLIAPLLESTLQQLKQHAEAR